jgi:hypothetical protein
LAVDRPEASVARGTSYNVLVPDLTFREEEPQRTISVTPTIARQAEVERAVSETRSETPRVRYAEWQGPDQPLPVGGFQIPVWLFAAGSAVVWITLGIMFLLPKQYIRSSVHPDAQIPVPAAIFALFFSLVAAIPLLTIALVQAQASQNRFRRSMRTERAPGSQRTLARLLAPDSLQSETEVSALYLQDGFICGQDRGLLRTEGSSLYFEGSRTQFSICKSRLIAKRPKSVRRLVLTGGDRAQAFTRLSYRLDGVLYGFAFVNTNPNGVNCAKRDFAGLIRWLDHPCEPAEFEVLLPKTIPSGAPRETLASLRGPLLAAQGLLILVGLGVSAYLTDLHARHLGPVPADLFILLFFVCTMLVLEVAWIGTTFAALPIIRGLRRYRFLRSRVP